MPGVLSAPGEDDAPLRASPGGDARHGAVRVSPRVWPSSPRCSPGRGSGLPQAHSCPLPRPWTGTRHTRGVPSYTQRRGRAGPRALGLAAGGPGGCAGRGAIPIPPLLGPAAPTPHPQPSLIIPNPHPSRRINKACLVPPPPRRPCPGPLTYSNSVSHWDHPVIRGSFAGAVKGGQGGAGLTPNPWQEADAHSNLLLMKEN